MPRNVFLRENRTARSDTPDQRQGQLHDACMGQRELMRGVVGMAVVQQENAARRTGCKLKHALTRQGPQVFFGRVGRTEAEFGCDLRARGRKPGPLDGALDQLEYFLLPGSQFAQFSHVRGAPCRPFVYCMDEQMTVVLYSIRLFSSFTL